MRVLKLYRFVVDNYYRVSVWACSKRQAILLLRDHNPYLATYPIRSFVHLKF